MRTFRRIAALYAVFLLAFFFSAVAYAGGGEEIPQEIMHSPAPEAGPNPFTPAGTGTVVDNATDEDGKEFYTVMTPDENVFYLVIDKQRGQNNVYFLNAVTEKDLLALAEKSGDSPDWESTLSEPEPESTPEVTPEPTPEPEPGQKSNMGTFLLVLAVVVIGGGVGYYVKIYRPKQEQAALADEDYDEYEADLDDDQEDDTPPWDTDNEHPDNREDKDV
ncbi:DUF4366 domain-containing protein [Cohnella hongkongensis]|uniref:DUF4366 domain-containing protein n=1 Tax=Cohnella hongkongensis TaxID=178337 RepID=A0ABV9F8Z7_9BACL